MLISIPIKMKMLTLLSTRSPQTVTPQNIFSLKQDLTTLTKLLIADSELNGAIEDDDFDSFMFWNNL